MNNDLYTFPSNKLEALTILYLQNQDLSQLSPTELIEKYYQVYEELKQANIEVRKRIY